MEFLRDVRYAARSLGRGGFVAALTVLTLSLGIGVVTALFAVTDAVLLQPLVPAQDRVVRVGKIDPRRESSLPGSLSLHEFEEWRDRSRSFEAVAAVDHAASGTTTIAIDGQNFPIRLSPVSADVFRVIAPGPPLAGRWLTESDELPGADLAAVVSERFWRRAAGSDPSLVGRRLSLGGSRMVLVVGIAPAVVDYPLATEIWLPGATLFDGKATQFDASQRTFSQFELVGRLRPGVSIDQARAELSVVHRRVVDDFPKDYQAMQVTIEPLLDTVVGNSGRVVLALLAAASLVFIIAGVNVAALLLMRAAVRRHEVAVRVALGAGRSQLLRQTAAEAFVLGVPGALGGLFVASALLAGVQWLAPGDMPRIEQAVLDSRVLTFAIVAALGWVLALGTLPVWMQQRGTKSPHLEHSFRVVRHARGLLIFTAAQIAAAVVVAIGAGLLVRTLGHLQAIERGFNSSDLLVVSLLLPQSRQGEPRAMRAMYDELLPQVASMPGVRSVSPVHFGPGSGTFGLSAPMLFEGQTVEEGKTNPWSTWEPVLPSYFQTLGIPIVRGREFTNADRQGGAPVAIVSEALARRYWPGQDPLGKRLKFVDTDEWPWVTVVGVAADTRYRELTKTWMTAYFPADQFFFFGPASLVVRTSQPPEALVPAIMQRVRAIEPGATLNSVASMDALLGRELARPRTAVTVTAVFALAAIVLAAVGVYGVMANEVRQRRRELAVRYAVGASPNDIFGAVFRRSLIVGAAGTATGLVIAASATRALRSILFEVQPLDPIAFALGAGALLTVVVIATYFPARFAAATDPATALRSE